MKLAHEGLEAITIGRVAELMNLQPRRVFSRVGSPRAAAVRRAGSDRRSAQAVILPAQRPWRLLEQLRPCWCAGPSAWAAK